LNTYILYAEIHSKQTLDAKFQGKLHDFNERLKGSVRCKQLQFL